MLRNTIKMEQNIILMLAIVFIFFFLVKPCITKAEDFNNSIGEAPKHLVKSVSYTEPNSDIKAQNDIDYEKEADFESEYTDLTAYFSTDVKN